jgi:hypothetical protein
MAGKTVAGVRQELGGGTRPDRYAPDPPEFHPLLAPDSHGDARGCEAGAAEADVARPQVNAVPLRAAYGRGDRLLAVFGLLERSRAGTSGSIKGGSNRRRL